MLKKILQGTAVGLVAGLLAMGLQFAGVLAELEYGTWAWRVRTLARKSPATDRIKVIALDQYALDWGMHPDRQWSWPWPRVVHSTILSFCRRARVKAIAFDLLFTEYSSEGVEDDLLLGQEAVATTNFVTAVLLGTEGGSWTNWPASPVRRDVEIERLPEWQAGALTGPLDYPRAGFPVPEIATNVAWFGGVSATPDLDGVIRRAALFSTFAGRIMPSLALAMRLAAEPGIPVALERGLLRVGDGCIPIDASGRAVLRFVGPSGTHERFNVAAVVQSELRLREGEKPVLEPSAFDDCYVIFGLTAPGLMDLKSTAISASYPGVEIHATMLDNILQQEFLDDVPRAAGPAAALVLGILAAVLGRLTRNARQTVALFVVFLALPLAAGVLGYQAGYWIPVATPWVSVALALVAIVIVDYALEGHQKRFIKNAFKRYLSPHVIDQLVLQPDRLKLGGEKRELSIFFSDLQGFTGISEGLDPETLTALLNDYLTAMTDIIQEEYGTVDKYEGDAIIAFWNAPLSVPDHAVRAVRAALRCQAKLAELRPQFRERTGKDLYMRIGLNTGEVVVGNMGSHKRFDYTMLGDAANLAARLEGINKQFGSYTMISETTRAQIGDAFAVRELSRVAVVGRKEPVRVFEPMQEDEHQARSAELEQFAQGLAAYYEGKFEAALKRLEPLADGDPPAAAYCRRIRMLQAEPVEPWDGVWVMTEK